MTTGAAGKRASLRGWAAPLAIASLLLGIAPATAQERRAPGGTAIRAVAHGFHAALAAGDSAAALGQLHPDAAIYEAGHAEDLDEYRSGHLAADLEFARSVVFETVRETVVPGAALAIYLREYTATGTLRGREIDARGVETMVMERTPAGWKIRHIHWSSR